jgi:hypothetical protein
VLGRGQHQRQASSLTTFLARLGCTRIGSPGIFGERNTKALFIGVKPQVGREHKWVGYRASFSRPGPRERGLAAGSFVRVTPADRRRLAGGCPQDSMSLPVWCGWSSSDSLAPPSTSPGAGVLRRARLPGVSRRATAARAEQQSCSEVLGALADVLAQGSGSSCWTSRSGISSTVTGTGSAGPKTLPADVTVPFSTYCM